MSDEQKQDQNQDQEKPILDVEGLGESELESINLEDYLKSEEESDSRESETKEEKEKEEEIKSETETEEETEKETETKTETETETEKKDPLKETQAAYTKSQQKLKEMEKKVEDLEYQMRLQKLDMDELTESELEELKTVDPDLYVEYKLNQQEKKQIEETRQNQQKHTTAERQVNELVSFCQSLGLNSDQEMVQYLNSPEFLEVDKLLDSEFKRNSDGVYSSRQIQMAYQSLYPGSNGKNNSQQQSILDKIISSRKDSEMKKAETSMMDRSANKDTTKSHKVRTIDSLSQKDLENLSESECAELLKDYST